MPKPQQRAVAASTSPSQTKGPPLSFRILPLRPDFRPTRSRVHPIGDGDESSHPRFTVGCRARDRERSAGEPLQPSQGKGNNLSKRAGIGSLQDPNDSKRFHELGCVVRNGHNPLCLLRFTRIMLMTIRFGNGPNGRSRGTVARPPSRAWRVIGQDGWPRNRPDEISFDRVSPASGIFLKHP